MLNACHAELIKMLRPLLIFSQSDYLIQVVDANSHTNSADPDQLASTLFQKTEHTWVQQDKG